MLHTLMRHLSWVKPIMSNKEQKKTQKFSWLFLVVLADIGQHMDISCKNSKDI